MYIYFDKNGALKEIITERPFRQGDSKRNKIYVYWEGDHSPLSGWVKYRLPNGTYTAETTFSITKVGKELPTKPARNLDFFNYEHTYTDATGTHTGYLFYEITVPDAVLSSSLDNNDKIPTENNLVACSVRFVIDEGDVENTNIDSDDEIEELGLIVFSVETTMGIITDSSINITQYNYLIEQTSEAVNKATWGNITGDIDDQTDLQNALDEKVDNVYDVNTTTIDYTATGNFAITSEMMNDLFTEKPQFIKIKVKGRIALFTLIRIDDNELEYTRADEYINWSWTDSKLTLADGYALFRYSTSLMTLSAHGTEVALYTQSQTNNLLEGKANLSGADFIGSITAPSIIETMEGYEWTNGTATNVSVEPIYIGVVKTGNKLTCVFCANITRQADDVYNVRVGRLTIPSSIGQKLIPTQVGTFSWLDLKSIDGFSAATTSVSMFARIEKISNVLIDVYFSLNNCVVNTKYYVRYEVTFLLSDNLAEE